MELKSQFISTVSHELRTPLAAMKEGLSIVFDGVTGRINKKQKKFLGIAMRNANRLSDLINNVLDFQRLGAGKTKLGIQSHDIEEVLSEVQETMNLFAKKHGVELLAFKMSRIGRSTWIPANSHLPRRQNGQATTWLSRRYIRSWLLE